MLLPYGECNKPSAAAGSGSATWQEHERDQQRTVKTFLWLKKIGVQKVGIGVRIKSLSTFHPQITFIDHVF